MNNQWQVYCEKYGQLSVREQYLILLSGLVAVFFLIFYIVIDPTIATNKKTNHTIERLTRSNASLTQSIAELESALKQDPNEVTRQKIAQFEAKLKKVDAKLLTLTSDLINPVQMRHALIDLLKLEKGVSLLSFELLEAEPLLSLKNHETSKQGTNQDSATLSTNQAHSIGQNLYRHGIKIKLSGSYFELQDYLKHLELLPWKFFWQDFNLKSEKYPNSEVDIIIYSLSTNKEFVGV